MIPLELQDGLKKRVESIFENYRYKRPSKDNEETDQLTSMHVYTQNLPVKESKDDSPFPFVLIKLEEGNQANLIDADHLVNVNLIVGMYDSDNDNQGYRDVSLVLNKIFESISRNPVIDGVFDLNANSKINWSISDEETGPFYFGGIGFTFTAPKFEREDLEGLI